MGGSICDRTLPGRCRALGPQNQTNNVDVYVLEVWFCLTL